MGSLIRISTRDSTEFEKSARGAISAADPINNEFFTNSRLPIFIVYIIVLSGVLADSASRGSLAENTLRRTENRLTGFSQNDLLYCRNANI